ncbi:MAG: sulfite exporter TauE/SafE family protein [Candidatus Limnocylindrales bacterium]
MAVGLVMIGAGIGAGIFGSLLGLGGGILLVPLLTLGFGLPLREAAGISLICVIVTSSAAASVYLERHVANLRLGMSLELFTALGAIGGGILAFTLGERQLDGLFAILLAYVALSMIRRGDPEPETVDPPADPADDPGLAPPVVPGAAQGSEAAATTLSDPATRSDVIDRLSGPGYRVHSLGRGVIGSIGAGVVSALFGIGGGLVKVPVMHLVMGVPLRIATATSNLMIGVTASASAIIYLARGGIDPYVAGPTAIGVFVGASVGSRVAGRVDVRVLRILFTVVLLFTAFEMLQRALS